MKSIKRGSRVNISTVIAQNLGMSFENEALLKQAFTHSSYANEKNNYDDKQTKIEHNERLEFLGDAVLELVISEYLFHNFLQWPEGKLTKFRAQLVCEQSLSTLAKNCGFDNLLIVGKGAQVSQIKNRPAVLCDVFEAFVGALYLDKGLAVAKAFILSQIEPLVTEQTLNVFVDYKTLLQEKLQEHGTVHIQYQIIKEDGPPHDKVFVATVSLNDKLMGTGSGKSKKEAHQQAAKVAYEQL